MAVYTYKDFEDYANQNGILNSFNDYDIALARANPDAGMEIARSKVDYGSAATAEAKALAQSKAESVRKTYGGYTGGTDGAAPSFTASNYDTGEYADPYKLEKQKALSEVVNFDDNYSPDTDPLAQSYRRAALRSAKEAEKGTLSAIAGANGGQVSTSAAAATAQASAEARAKIADKYPELYEAAYNRALNNYSAARSASADSQDAFSTAIANKWSVVNNKLSEAAAKAAVGDYSGYDALGIDTGKYQSYEQLQRDLETASVAAQYGDYSKFSALGFDVTRALKEQEMSDAQLAAQYGDTSKLSALGYDTSLYNENLRLEQEANRANIDATRASIANTNASTSNIYSGIKTTDAYDELWKTYSENPNSLSSAQMSAMLDDAKTKVDDGQANMTQVYFAITHGETVSVENAEKIAEDYNLQIDLQPKKIKVATVVSGQGGAKKRVNTATTKEVPLSDEEATTRLAAAIKTEIGR